MFQKVTAKVALFSIVVQLFLPFNISLQNGDTGLPELALESLSTYAAGPGDVGTGSLTLWLDADDSTTLFTDKACSVPAADGNDIGCWQDKSGQANHVSVAVDGAKEPTYNLAQLNSKATLDFNADSLVASDADQIASNTSYTKFVVYKQDVAAGVQNVISSSTSNSHAFYTNGSSNIKLWHGGDFAQSSIANGTTNYNVVSGRYAAPDGGTNIININGAQGVSNTTTSSFSTVTNTQIGAHDAGVNNLDGKIAEAIIYDRALSDTEIDTMECYLGDKWGILVPHCPSYTLSQTALTLGENGGTATFTVVLGQAPSSAVVFDVSSNDTSEATISPALLTFTNADWNTAQTVTVTGIDDSVTTNDTATITVSVNDVASDNDYDDLADKTVAVTLTNDDITSLSLTKTNYPEYKVFQRDTSNQYDFALSGTYSGSCSSVEASFASGSYVTVDASPTGGTFSGALNNQGVGQGILSVRCSNDISANDSVNNLGVGDIYIVAGQSNAEGHGINAQLFSTTATSSSIFPVVYTDGDVRKIGNDSTDPGGTAGSVWPLIGGYIAENENIPVEFITTADGGKGLVNPAHWKKGAGVNCAKGVPCYTNMLNQVSEANPNAVKAVLWFQGETDALNNVTQAAYNAGLDELLTNIQADIPAISGSSVKLMVGVIGHTSTASDLQANSIRQAMYEAINDTADIIAGPATYDISALPDNIHFRTDAQIRKKADRWWAAMDAAFYGGADGRGPILTSATAGAGNTTITLNFTETSTPIIVSNSALNGIRFVDNGSTLTPTSFVASGATATAAFATVFNPANTLVSVGSNNDAYSSTTFGSTNPITDSSPFNLPAETVIDVAVTPSTDPNLSYNGAFSENTADDGTLTGSIVVTLSNDTFVNPITLATHLTITNNASGLTPVITRDSNTQVTITMTGTASNHLNSDDVSNLTITWLDGAFTTTSMAVNVTGYQKTDGIINFIDDTAPMLTVTGSLTLWLDAEDIDADGIPEGALESGIVSGDVATWKDKSGQNNDVSGTARPTFIPNILHSKPVLDFDADNLVTSVGGQITANGSYTKFVVFSYDTTTGNNNLISSTSNGTAFWGGAAPNNDRLHSWNLANGGANPGYVSSGLISIGNYHIGSNRYDNIAGDGADTNKLSVLNVDGTQVDSDDTVHNHTSQIISIGAHAGANNLDGKIAEALVYNRALSDSEIDIVECYLSAKWGITVPHDCTAPVITLTGSGTITLEIGDSYTDAGATYTDNVDGTGSIVAAGGPVTTTSTGSFTLTYNHTDTAGNAATQVTRTVNVVDTTAPLTPSVGSFIPNPAMSGETVTLSLTGVETGATVTVSGMTCIPTPATASGTVDCTATSTGGLLDGSNNTISVTDATGNINTGATVPTLVIDDTPPVTPTAVLPSNFNPFVGTGEPGSTVTIYSSTGAIIGTGTISGSGTFSITANPIPSTGPVTFTTTDSAGNTSTGASIGTGSIDITPPVTPTVNLPSNFSPITGTGEPGSEVTIYSSTGAVIGTGTVSGSGTFSITANPIPSTGPVTFTTTDSAGNTSTGASIGTGSIDTTLPVITLVGSGTITHELNTAYTDAGAEFSDNISGTGAVTASGVVDTSATGTTILTYDYTDTAGNAASQVNRTVNVIESTLDTDSDGVPDIVEISQGTSPTNSGSFLDTDNDNTPDFTDLDDDGDGSLDAIEVAAPNSGDFNNDGITDILQQNVATIVSSVNSEYVGLDTTGGSCSSISFNIIAESTLSNQDARDFPLGLADFNLQCSSTGATTNIKVYYDKVYNTSDWVYKKYNQTTQTYSDLTVVYSTETVGSGSVTVVSYSATDGGLNDEDGIANGVIVDPSGPSVIAPMPSSSGGGGRTYSCRDPEALNYKTYGFSKPELCEYNTDITLIVPESEDKAQDAEDAKDVIQEETANIEILIKDADYTLENNFDTCPVVRDIQNSDYIYSGERYSDTALSKYKSEIDKFSQIGIINGYEDGSFGPNNEMTRTEFLKVALISHCFEYKNEDPSSLIYIDVDTTSWQAKVITKAQSLGMINGDKDENGKSIFRPNDIISKAEAVKILMRLSLISPRNPVELGYRDITTSWHAKYVITGETLGLFNAEDDNGIFNPDEGVKREGMIDLVNKLVKFYK